MEENKTKTFEIWTEGFAVTGQSSRAIFHGKFKGETFKDAVIAFKETVTDKHSRDCIDTDKLVFWGCRFFDNEVEARKLFG